MKYIWLLLIFGSALQVQMVTDAQETECGSEPAICWLIGDPHIRKFNGNEYLFSLSGKILALTDRKSVWVRLAVTKTERASQITSVYIDFIYQDGSRFGKRTKVVLKKDPDHVKINYRIRPLPYYKWGVQVNKARTGILVDYDGFHIKWLKSSKLFIVIGTQYAGKVEGECGLFCSQPPGKGHSTARRSFSRSVLRLYRPYNDNVNLQDRIRQVVGPHLFDVKVTVTNDQHTSQVLNITMLEDAPTKVIQEEIKSKLLEGKDKDGKTLSQLLNDEVVAVEVAEPEVMLKPNEFDVPKEIEEGDEDDDDA